MILFVSLIAVPSLSPLIHRCASAKTLKEYHMAGLDIMDFRARMRAFVIPKQLLVTCLLAFSKRLCCCPVRQSEISKAAS